MKLKQKDCLSICVSAVEYHYTAYNRDSWFRGRFLETQFISFDVIVKEIKDDMTLYLTQHTIGVIAVQSLFLFPQMMILSNS